MSRPTLTNEQQARLVKLSRRAGDLQAVPAVITKALLCIDDPNSSINHVAAILNTDQIVAGRLIGLANSALYSGSRRFLTVREAVIRLGFRTVRDLLFATVIAGLARSPSRLYRLGPDKLWLHSLATAIAARVMAEEAGILDPETGYVAGLLHDIGRAILDRALKPAEMADVRAVVDNRKVSYQVAEQEVLGLTHCDIGAYRLARWGVAPELVEAVATHHRPESGTLAALVSAADVLAVKAMDLAANDPGWAYVVDLEALKPLGPTLASVVEEPVRLDAVLEKIRVGLSETAILP